MSDAVMAFLKFLAIDPGVDVFSDDTDITVEPLI